MAKQLDGIVKKLGHPLPEVRCRALRSLISKLDHGLIQESSLVPERSFVIKFLEWFNFDPAPMSEDVLRLLRVLSQHENARMILLSLGAVEFFTKLRKDVAEPLQQDIDAILKNLTIPASNQRVTEFNPSIHNAYDSKFFAKSSNLNSAAHDFAASYLAFPGFPWHFLTATDRHVLSSTSVSLGSSDPALVENACSFLLDVVLRDFPAEIFLQRPTIVNTLLILLRSGANASLSSIACKCLSCIASNLTTRILCYQDPDFHCPRQGLPGYYNSIKELTPQYDDVAIGSNSFERNLGDGRDRETSSSLSSEYSGSIQRDDKGINVHHPSEDENSLDTHSNSLDDDSFLASQLSQLSILEFSFSCLQAIAELFNVDCPQLFFNAYEVAVNCVNVLSHLFDTVALWNEEQVHSDGVRTRIKLLSGILSRSVLHHYHLDTVTENEFTLKKHFQSTQDSVFHRIAFQVCSVLFLRFLQGVIPIEKTYHLNSVRSAGTALLLISSDQAFKVSTPELHEIAVLYLDYFEEKEQLANLQTVLDSIKCVQEFKEVASQDGDYKSILHLAEDALDALPYYASDGVISQMVNLIALVNPTVLESHGEKAQSLLLKLMAHSNSKIQVETYISCQKIVLKMFESFNDSSKAISCYFLISKHVLHEIITRGLMSSSSSIKNAAQDIILSLLRGKYFMEDNLWQMFLNEIKYALPALQSFAGESEVLKKATLDFFSTYFTYLDQTICLLRFLTLKNRKVRAFANPSLIELLSFCDAEIVSSHDDRDMLRALFHCLQQVDDFTDRLVVHEPISKFDGVGKISLKSISANEDLMLQMLSTLRSRETTKAKRLTTLQQLSCILTTRESHDIFLKSEGLLTIKRHFCQIGTNSVLTKNENEEASLCALILRKISVENEEIRKSLKELPTVLALLRFVVLSHNFSATSELCMQLLTFVIMHDILKNQNNEESSNSAVPVSLSLPSRVMSHYHISFPCHPHDVISLHHSIDVMQGFSDKLLQGPASFAIKLGSLLAKNSKCEHAVKCIEGKISQIADSSHHQDNLLDLKMQKFALICSDPETYLKEFVSTIVNAKMHAAVKRSVCLLRILLITYPLKYLKAMLASDYWREALENFLLVQPSNTEDIRLLCDVVLLLSDVLSAVPSVRLPSENNEQSCKENLKSTLIWYLEIMCGAQSSQEVPLLEQLKIPTMKNDQLSALDPRTKEQRHLCKSILSLMSHISTTIFVLSDETMIHKFQSALCRIILLRLKLANTPRYYDLPSMEVTLDCLLHYTAAFAEQKHPMGSVYDGVSMSTQLMSSLFEVVSAFHIENSGSSMSYMGRGVSKTATQNIVNLVLGAANESDKDAKKLLDWLDTVSRNFTSSERAREKYTSGKHKRSYKWILALWSARDPMIRYCGLVLTGVVTRTKTSSNMMQDYFKEYSGGIWRALFSVLFDCTECAAVRTQSALVCCNLIFHFNPSENASMPAAEFAKLLHRFGFSQGITHLISRYNPKCWIKPSSFILYPHMYPVDAAFSQSSENTYLGNVPTLADDNQRCKDRTPSPEMESRSTQFSNGSNGSDFPPEWEASVTPSLVAAVCQFLGNIFSTFDDLSVVQHHEEIVHSVACLMDAGLLESALNKLESANSIDIAKGRIQYFVCSLMRHYSESCKMLHIYASKNSDMATQLVRDNYIFSNIISLATLTFSHNLVDWQVRRNAMDLLSCLIGSCTTVQDIEIIRGIVMMVWTRFLDYVQSLFSHEQGYEFAVSALTMMANVISVVDISNESAWDSAAVNDIAELSMLCIDIFKTVSKSKECSKTNAVLKCSHALNSFLAFPACRVKAFEAGFLKYLFQEIDAILIAIVKQTQNESCNKDAKNKKTVDRKISTMGNLHILLQVLSSLLVSTPTIQIPASDFGMCRILATLWKKLSSVPKFKLTLLKLAISYTVCCEETCTSLCAYMQGKESFVSNVILEAQDMNKSIVNGSKVNQFDFTAVYCLLCNLSNSRECRSLFWKSGLLNCFPLAADKGQHPRSTKLQQMLMYQWLKLLHIISFFSDGQLNVLRIQDILEILYGIYSSTDYSDIVFKILSNLCYHPPSKARISSSTHTIDIISNGLLSDARCRSVSSLRALLHGCQKSKVFLKNAAIPEKLLNARDTFSADCDFNIYSALLLKELHA